MNLFSFIGIFIFGFSIWLTQGRVDPSNTAAGGVVLFSFAFFILYFHYSHRIHLKSSAFLKLLLCLPIILFSVMSLLRDNLMYASLVQNNPNLAFIGPLRWIPENSYYLFKFTLWITVLLLIVSAIANIFDIEITMRSDWFFLLLGLFLFVLTLRVSPLPIIDVFTTNTTATLKLLEGMNPYAVNYVDIYNGSAGYLPSFGYLPGYFLAGVPALVLGDVRLASVVSLLLAGYLVISKYKNCKNYRLISASAFACILLGGSSFFIIEQAWIDPIIALTILCGAVFLEKKQFILAGVFCGVAIAIKQYSFIAVILLMLFSLKKYGIKKTSALIKTSFAVSSLIIVPFILWDSGRFYESAIAGIQKLPPRVDSLSLRSFIILRTGFDLPSVSFFLPLGFCLLYARRFWRELENLSGAFMSMGFIYFIIFFFSSHAFANYYHLVYLFFFFSFFFSLYDEKSCP